LSINIQRGMGGIRMVRVIKYPLKSGLETG